MYNTTTEHHSFFAGLDLGQSRDYSALAILDRLQVIEGDSRTTTFDTKGNIVSPPRMPPTYSLRHLERFALGTSYTTVVDRVVSAFSRPPLSGTTLAVDETGCGRPVVDMLRKAKPRVTVRPILITGGSAVTQEGPGWHVPKKQLASILQVLLQSRRLTVVKSMPEAATLVKELQAFRVKVSAAGTEQFEAWREKDHDDLVLAVAIAAWVAERGVQRLFMRIDGETIR
jgi:hypothetical protein